VSYLIAFLIVALIPLSVWLTYKRTVRVHLTREQKQRRELLNKIGPYVSHRNRDVPGQALRRGAYLAWVNKKITTRERDQFAKRRSK
jgi:hypothetical protein